MKKILKHLLFSTLLLGLFGAALAVKPAVSQSVEADSVNPYPSSGRSGTLMFVNGVGTYFKSGEADLAVCCLDSNSNYAWTDKCTYRVTGDTIRVMIPYLNGESHQWSKFKACRYNPSLDPKVNGDGGVYNETEFIYFSSFLQQQNTITISGYGEGNRINVSSVKSYISYYGIKSDTHIYLDLSSFTDWEKDDAKFAIYFAYPSVTDEKRWGQSYYNKVYYSSFCWKVNGQDNEHLYECVVPVVSDGNLWNMVIAARIDKSAESPNWDQRHNQTQDLVFTSSNHSANMIKVTGWGSAELSVSIPKEDRLDFYGRYFNNTVVCSGSGESDATTSEMWNAVQYEYEHQLSKSFQGAIWLTTADKAGTLIQQAMARYDYIVLYKQYGHTDFINRAESPNKTVYESPVVTIVSNETNNYDFMLPLILIVTITSVSLTMLIVLKRKQR